MVVSELGRLVVFELALKVDVAFADVECCADVVRGQESTTNRRISVLVDAIQELNDLNGTASP